MSNSFKPEKIISAMATLVAAVTNMKLYPSTSAIITNAIEKAYNSVRSAIVQNDDLLISESENNILISGEALSYKHQQLPQIASLREIMGGFRIKSIIIKKDVEKQDFRKLLTILSMAPEEVDMEGGLQAIIAKTDLANIVMTPKIFVTPNQEREILGSLEPADIKLIKSFVGEHRIDENDSMRINEKSGDPKWVASLFESGLRQLEESSSSAMDKFSIRTMGEMFDAFSASEDKKSVSEGIVKSLFNPESDAFSVVIANNNDTPVFNDIIDQLDDDQFSDLIAKIARILEEEGYEGNKLSKEEKSNFDKTYKKLAKNSRSPGLKKKIKTKIIAEKARARKERDLEQTALDKIMKGDQTLFTDKAVMGKMPDIIIKFYETGQPEKGRSLINILSSGLVSEDPEARAVVSDVLQKTGDRLSVKSDRKELMRIAHSLNLWVKTETELTPSFEPVCILLRNHIRYLLRHSQYAEANSLLETFSFIFQGRTPKSEQIKERAGRVLKNVATADIFDEIMNEFTTNSNGEGKNAYYTLIRLGLISVEPLLDLLRTSEDMSQRIRVMNAIGEIGKDALPAIEARLRGSSSWFYVRNLLKLLTQLGDSSNIDVLRKLIISEDQNISRAALNSAFDIGGDRRLKFFTTALSIEKDRLRAVVVDLLGKLKKPEVVNILIRLLKSDATGSAEGKDLLNIAICEAFEKIGSKKAIPALKAIVKQKGILGLGAYSQELRQAAESALKILNRAEEKNVEPVKKNEKPDLQTPSENNRPPALYDLSDMAGAEALVNEYAKQGNKPEAVSLLFNMIEKLAKEKHFQKAEKMRSRLFEIDPMALTEIVKSGDIIESEKASGISQEYMNIWSNLYETLTEEEANALYYNVRIEEYDLDTIIIRQGAENSKLYFINRGQLKIVYEQDGNEFFLKMIGAGDVAGAETFFPIAVSTISLISLSGVRLGYLERDQLTALTKKYPLIENKLISYCMTGDSVDVLINKKGIERRQQERIDVKGKALVQLLDTMNKPMAKPFKGDMIDVSRGGLAFRINTNRKETARLLLGRKLKMVVGIVTTEKPIEISTKGTIIGAKEKKEGQYSIHLRFDSPVSDKKISTIRSIAVPE